MKKKASHHFSLYRTLPVFLGGLYSVIVLLLVILDVLSISNYQSARKTQTENLLYRYTAEIEQARSGIDRELYSIYQSNDNFDIVAAGSYELQEFIASSNLTDALQVLLSTDENLHGYVVLYSNLEKNWHWTDTDQMELDDIAGIVDQVQAAAQTMGNQRKQLAVEVNGHVYWCCIYRKNGAAVAGIMCLDNFGRKLQSEIADYLGTTVSCFYLDNDNGPVGGEELGEQYGTIQPTINTGNYFYETSVKNSHIYAERVSGTSMWLCASAQASLWSYLNMPQFFLGILVIAAIIFVFYFVRFVQRQALAPLGRLVEDMRAIEAGDYERQITVDTPLDEIQMVGDTLQHMVTALEEQKVISYEQTIEKQKAQLQYLSMQLKPHFYLNGLKTLNILAMSGENQRIQDIIMRLSYHMRYILQLEKELVFLQEEIDYVNNYAELRRDMTDRPLSVSWDIEEGLDTGWKIPTLGIQTFVENSFKYAKVGNINSELVVRISITELETEDGRFLDICMQDNGDGYPERILDDINGDPLENSPSVGINNLKRRCRLLYGDWAEYSFYNDDGAVSELILPWKNKV